MLPSSYSGHHRNRAAQVHLGMSQRSSLTQRREGRRRQCAATNSWFQQRNLRKVGLWFHDMKLMLNDVTWWNISTCAHFKKQLGSSRASPVRCTLKVLVFVKKCCAGNVMYLTYRQNLSLRRSNVSWTTRSLTLVGFHEGCTARFYTTCSASHVDGHDHLRNQQSTLCGHMHPTVTIHDLCIQQNLCDGS